MLRMPELDKRMPDLCVDVESWRTTALDCEGDAEESRQEGRLLIANAIYDAARDLSTAQEVARSRARVLSEDLARLGDSGEIPQGDLRITLQEVYTRLANAEAAYSRMAQLVEIWNVGLGD